MELKIDMDAREVKKAESYFSAVVEELAKANDTAVCSIVITHLLTDRPHLLRAVNRIANIACLLPKPKSIHPLVYSWIRHEYPTQLMTRENFSDPASLNRFIAEKTQGRKFIVLDIGGYFADAIFSITDQFGENFIGVIEDTENGIRRYENLGIIQKPVVQVARSPLKSPEDFLVGQSIVFSVEALLRERGDILHGRTACVVGYGKVGRSICGLLQSRHVRVVVYEIDPIRKVEAMAHGFMVAPTIDAGLYNAGLVFCATGNLSLRLRQFEQLENGAYVATVTSSDDELDLASLRSHYEIRHVAEYITRYRRGDHYFYILNRGQAVNFIHGASVGPFIYLVHGEIVASMGKLIAGDYTPGVCENEVTVRRRVAEIWSEHYAHRI